MTDSTLTYIGPPEGAPPDSGEGPLDPGSALTALSSINSRLRLWIEQQDPTAAGEVIDPPVDARVLTNLGNAARRIVRQADLIEYRCRRGEIRAETETIISRVEAEER